MTLKSIYPQPSEGKGLLSRLFSKKQRSPSGADPSIFVEQTITGEEDILHIPQLPSFDGKIKQSSSELLLSYLTVPYLRIPLVLNFFANPEMIPALSVLDVQALIDSVVFEPGEWHPPVQKIAPESIPAPDRGFLATPLGLLSNELKMSPQGLLQCLNHLLDCALDLDPGSYTEESGFMILYTVRLLIRIQGFMLYFINHHRWSKTDDVHRSKWEGYVRGLDSNDLHIQSMADHLRALRTSFDEQVAPMLESWIDQALKKDDNATACLLYAHLAYIYLHTPLEDFTSQTVVNLISSQIFLHSHYHFYADSDTGKKTKRTAKGIQTIGLGISDIEIFDLFQKQRGNVLKFLMSDNAKRNQALEAVIRSVTRGSASNKALHLWGKTRYWRNMDGMSNIGRFIPDPTPRTPEEQAEAEKKRMHTRRDLSKVETEINIQLGIFTLDNSPMEELDDKIYQLPDFKEVFGDATHLGCAAVKNSTKRKWVRVMGTRFDLQLWLPDDRPPKIPPQFSRKYSADSLAASEQWIPAIFEPVRSKYKFAATGDIFLPSNPYKQNDPYARMYLLEQELMVEKIEEANKIKSDFCVECKTKFSLTNKRHHCK
jgi:hypothetical protein